MVMLLNHGMMDADLKEIILKTEKKDKENLIGQMVPAMMVSGRITKEMEKGVLNGLIINYITVNGMKI